MIKAIIIDDEEYSIELLTKKITKLCPEVHIVASYTSPQIALAEVKSLQPDLIFLDIQMPGMSGLEWIEKIHPFDFSVVFVTAYDHFAIQALRLNALDYLLKPVAPDELKKCVERFKRIRKDSVSLTYDNLIKQIQSNQKSTQKIALHTNERVEFVAIDDIIRCQSSGTYTTFFLNSGRQIMVSTNIGEYEEMLQPYHFFRIHTSHLVNLKYVASYEKSEGGQVKLTDGALVDVSRRRKESFLLAMESM